MKRVQTLRQIKLAAVAGELVFVCEFFNLDIAGEADQLHPMNDIGAVVREVRVRTRSSRLPETVRCGHAFFLNCPRITFFSGVGDNMDCSFLAHISSASRFSGK